MDEVPRTSAAVTCIFSLLANSLQQRKHSIQSTNKKSIIMDYETTILEYMSDVNPRAEAERLLAIDFHKLMNDLDKEVCKRYEEELKFRCDQLGEIYAPGGRSVVEYPVEWFIDNIKTNQFDAIKWRATLDEKLLELVKSKGVIVPNPQPAPQPVAPDQDAFGTCTQKEEQLLGACAIIDRQIEDSFDLKEGKTKPVLSRRGAGGGLGLVVVGVVVGVMVLGSLLGNGMRGGWTKNKPQPPSTRGPQLPPPVPQPRPNPTPAPEPDTTAANTARDKLRDDRKKRRDKVKEKDKKRRDRKDFYFGYVDRILKLENANNVFEIRVDAMAENSLSDEVFTREFQKLSTASGSPNFTRYGLALITIYVRQLPTGVQVGDWINFKVDTKNKRLAEPNTPNLASAFTDGVTILEPLKPTVNFSALSWDSFFEDDNGWIVSTDVKTIKKDLPATALNILQTAFGGISSFNDTMNSTLGRVMNVDFPGYAGRVPNSTPTAGIERVLSPSGSQITSYHVYDVGQGEYWNPQSWLRLTPPRSFFTRLRRVRSSIRF